MLKKKNQYSEYAHWAGIIAGITMIIVGFLAIFGMDFTIKATFVVHLLMLVLGSLVLLVEIDNDYLPGQYKIIFKSNKIRAYTYFVIGILLLSSGLPSIILIISAIFYIL